MRHPQETGVLRQANPHPIQWIQNSGFCAATILLVLSPICSHPALAQSQIEADTTLGSESSRVIPNYRGFAVEVITDGAPRGQNLFHSLRQFNREWWRSDCSC
jgi:hypothetical protein